MGQFENAFIEDCPLVLVLWYDNDDMGWIEPLYSNSEIDAAGRTFIASERAYELASALDVINNFRSSHNFVLNTLQSGLRHRAAKVCPDAIIAQRIKRLRSIVYKLERFSTMRLSAMQDIAGCRAIMPTVDQVYQLINIQRKSKIKHKLAKFTDYIQNPRPSGYRGYHLIYNYFSDRTKKYNGLNVEMQIRSMLQHYWATAVETASMFTKQSLKSSVGEPGWLRFFALMGTVHAFTEEQPLVPGTPTDLAQLQHEIRELNIDCDILKRLRMFSGSLQLISSGEVPDAHYHVLELDTEKFSLTPYGYKRNQLMDAIKKYEEREKRAMSSGVDVVLVSGETITGLRRAYPNYFADTHEFLHTVEGVLQ